MKTGKHFLMKNKHTYLKGTPFAFYKFNLFNAVRILEVSIKFE